MGKVDCIVEMREEQFEAGFREGLLKAAKFLLKRGFSSLEVSSDMDLPIGKVEELKREIESFK